MLQISCVESKEHGNLKPETAGKFVTAILEWYYDFRMHVVIHANIVIESIEIEKDSGPFYEDVRVYFKGKIFDVPFISDIHLNFKKSFRRVKEKEPVDKKLTKHIVDKLKENQHFIERQRRDLTGVLERASGVG